MFSPRVRLEVRTVVKILVSNMLHLLFWMPLQGFGIQLKPSIGEPYSMVCESKYGFGQLCSLEVQIEEETNFYFDYYHDGALLFGDGRSSNKIGLPVSPSDGALLIKAGPPLSLPKGLSLRIFFQSWDTRWWVDIISDDLFDNQGDFREGQ